jgi:hypothetical protein
LGRLRHRLNVLYEDRLDGRITKALYDEKSKTTQEQVATVERKLVEARSSELPPLTTALDVLRLTSNACNAFRVQPEPEQRKLLTMMQEAQWKDRRLQTLCSNHLNFCGARTGRTSMKSMGTVGQKGIVKFGSPRRTLIRNRNGEYSRRHLLPRVNQQVEFGDAIPHMAPQKPWFPTTSPPHCATQVIDY